MKKHSKELLVKTVVEKRKEKKKLSKKKEGPHKLIIDYG